MRAKGEREIEPEECLVFEDSVTGVEAGRRAGMRAIWCPHSELLKEYHGKEDEVLAGIANGCEDGTGAVGDGWAEMVRTLEGFGVTKYGIKV